MMTFPLRIVAPLGVSVLALAAAYNARPGAAPPGDPATVGIILPRAQLAQGADISAALRQSLTSGLSAARVQAVPLDSSDEKQAMLEAAQKNCAYLLYTRVTQAHGGGGGLLGKMSKMAKPPHPGGDPNAAQPSGTASQDSQSAASAIAAAEQSNVKAGDIVTLEYRLLPRGSMTPVSSGKLEGKAQADGDDVLSPLISQLSNTIASAAATGSVAATQPPSGSKSNEKGGRTNTAASSNTGLPPGMDCDQVAKASRGSMSLETCQKMMAAQQAYNTALADPGASKPGDDKMSCDEIMAEIKQQPFNAPDKAKVEEGKAASADLQKTLADQQKEATEKVAAESAAMSVTSMLATTFGGNAAGAAASQKFDAENKAMGERMAKEDAPKMDRVTSNTADLMADMTSQPAANPRLARLLQLATQKNCKGQ
jgi:hypothetical protein